MTFKIDTDNGVAGIATLTPIVRAWHAATIERKSAEIAVRRESFGVLLPKMVAMSVALITFAEANGGSGDTPLGVVLEAAAKASEELRAILPKNGSERASQINSLRKHHTDALLAEYVESCAAQTHTVDTDVREWAETAPTIGGYCTWLNVKRDDERGGKTLHALTNRVVSPPKANETPANDDSAPRDPAIVLAELAEAASKLPSGFVPADYKLDDFTAIAVFAALVVESRGLKITRKAMAI